MERDHELGARLERVLPPPAAPYGAKARIRRRLTQRLDRRDPFPSTLFLFALAAAVVLGLQIWKGTRATEAHSVVALETAVLVSRPSADLRIEQNDPTGAVIRVLSGTVWFHVRKETGRPFSVWAGATRVDVVGTVFGVFVGGANSASVEV